MKKRNLLKKDYFVASAFRTKCILAAISLFLFTPLLSQTKGKALVINLDEERSVTYLLKETPLVLFEGDSVVIKTEKLNSKFKKSDFKNITYADVDITSLDELDSAHPNKISYENDCIRVKCPAGEFISLYSIDGSLVYLRKTRPDHENIILLKQFSSGVYLLKTGNESFKVVIK